MAIKNLLVAYDGNEPAQKSLEFALQMAGKYNASVTALHITTMPHYDSRIRKLIPEGVESTMRELKREAAAGVEKAFREQVKQLGYKGDVHFLVEEGEPGITMARSARFFDILLLGQFTAPLTSERRRVNPEELLARVGRPVIIVPTKLAVRPFKEVAAIAWDGSSHAARALGDAMQVLETKKKIYVLTAQSEHKSNVGAMPGIDIAVHLKRHGVEAEKVQLEAAYRHIGRSILEFCDKVAPDVLVMGAFGRAKLGARLFGSVTRHILENHNLPVMLSH